MIQRETSLAAVESSHACAKSTAGTNGEHRLSRWPGGGLVGWTFFGEFLLRALTNADGFKIFETSKLGASFSG